MDSQFVIALMAFCLALAVHTPTTLAQQPEEVRTTLDDQQEVSVTIYNENLALVRDQR